MLKRRVPTPEEERISRIRKAWLGTFAALLVVVLLLVVWFGAAFSRRVEPVRLAPASPPDGLLVFRVGLLLDRAAEQGSGQAPAAQRLATRHAELLAAGLAPTGEVHFYRGGEHPRWLAFVSIVRPQRMYAHKISEALRESGAFHPAEAGPVDGAAGYYRLLPRGVLIASTPDFETPETAAGGHTLEAAAFYWYASAEGYIPPNWAARLPALEGNGAIELLWFQDQLRAVPPMRQDLPLRYFDPILPEPPEP